MSARRVTPSAKENRGCNAQKCIQQKIVCPCTGAASKLSRSTKRAPLSNLQDSALGSSHGQVARDSQRLHVQPKVDRTMSSGYNASMASLARSESIESFSDTRSMLSSTLKPQRAPALEMTVTSDYEPSMQIFSSNSANSTQISQRYQDSYRSNNSTFLQPLQQSQTLKAPSKPVGCCGSRGPVRSTNSSYSSQCCPSASSILTVDNSSRFRTLSSRDPSFTQYTSEYQISHRPRSVGSRTLANGSGFNSSNASAESTVANYGFLFGNKKITYTRDQLLESMATDDDVFVDGNEFFEGHESIRDFKNSPLILPVPVRRSTVFSDNERSKVTNTKPSRPAEKTTLSKRLQRRPSFRKTAYTCDIYVTEYLEDLINYLKHEEMLLLLKNCDIKQYFLIGERGAALDWLLQISEIYGNSEMIFYSAVRIFDWSIVNLKIRNSGYQLIAITSFWIAFKFYINDDVIYVSKLYALCGGKYTKKEILSAEKMILGKIGFDIGIAEPYIFLHYFLRLLRMEKNELLLHSASFVIECCALLDKFPLIPPSYLAFAALFVAYNIQNGGESTPYFYQQFSDWDMSTMQIYAKVLIRDVKCIIYNKEFTRGIILKYNNKEKLFVYKCFKTYFGEK